MHPGDITAFTISTPDLERSLAFYQTLGFREIMRADWPFPWIQVSDGVVLIMLRKDPTPYFALTWYIKNVEAVAEGLEKSGIRFTQKPGGSDALKRYLLVSPDGLNISLVGTPPGFAPPAGKSMLQMDSGDYFKPETYPNKVCGLFGELAHPVKDLQASIDFWKLLGLAVRSEFSSPYPWAIITDGQAVVGLHQSAHFHHPAITYFAADMDKKIDKLVECGMELKMQSPGNAVITTPEGQEIFLFMLGGATRETAKSRIDKLPRIVLETERLFLKELTPALMEQVITGMTDEEIMAYLGITSEKELQREKDNFAKGYSWYRSTCCNFVINDKNTGEALGRVGFHTWYTAHARAEIGYHISREENKRRGYMKEALRAIIRHGFTGMGLNRIEAFVGPGNRASQQLLRGLGFIEEGRLRAHYSKDGEIQDSLCFGLLRSEWQL